MEINRYVSFDIKKYFELQKFFKEQGIKYEETPYDFCFDIYESNINWPFVKEYIERENIFSWTETVFSQREINNAEWMRIRSVWHFGYPQPEIGFMNGEVTYDRKVKCPECGRGFKQFESFRIKKVPKWGNKHFGMLFGVEDELFVSETAKRILEQNCSGIYFRDVKSKSGKEIFEGVYQLEISNKLPEGIVNGNEISRDFDYCDNCGTKRILYNAREIIKFKKDIFDGACDFMKTWEYFGNDRLSCGLMIINKKTYQLIKQHKLDRGLEFQPIKLV